MGFVVVLEAPTALGGLELVGTSRGFDAEVVVADVPRETRAAWGEAVASKDGVGADATFDLDGQNGAAVLVWITNPTGSVVSIGDVKLTAA